MLPHLRDEKCRYICHYITLIVFCQYKGLDILVDDAKYALEGESGVFVRADGDGVDAHFDDRVIVAAWGGHVAEIEDVFFLDV